MTWRHSAINGPNGAIMKRMKARAASFLHGKKCTDRGRRSLMNCGPCERNGEGLESKPTTDDESGPIEKTRLLAAHRREQPGKIIEGGRAGAEQMINDAP